MKVIEAGLVSPNIRDSACCSASCSGSVLRMLPPMPPLPTLPILSSRRLALAILASTVALASGCGEVRGPEWDPGRLRVVSTIGMITDLAEQIGGERIQIRGLMGPGVDPHLYRARPSDLRALASADLVLYQGLFLEASLESVLEEMAERIPTVAVTRRIPRDLLLSPPEFEGAWDPHLWSDVSLWRLIATEILDALISIDPEGEAGYRERHDEVDRELKALDVWVRETVARVPPSRRILVTAHDAFHYFGRAYGFQVRALQGISTVAEAGARDVQDLVAFLLDEEVPAIFVESSVSDRMLEAVRRGVIAGGGDVRIGGMLYSDALGSPGTPAGTYAGMIRHNVQTIVDALGIDSLKGSEP
jgi:manganese/zinc/iron transport system substrate-binding protein